MSIFQDILAGDAAAFVNADEEAEAATYYAAGDRSTPTSGRDIEVYIMRTQPRPQAETHNQTMVEEIRIAVINDDTLGIAADELDTGKDTIELPRFPGDSTKQIYRIANRERVDAAMMVLRVR